MLRFLPCLHEWWGPQPPAVQAESSCTVYTKGDSSNRARAAFSKVTGDQVSALGSWTSEFKTSF